MSRREAFFAVALAAAGGFIIKGGFLISDPVGYILAGVLLAGYAWLVLGE